MIDADTDREAELRDLIRFAEGLGIEETAVRVIYEAVVANPVVATACRLEEVRRQLMKVMRQART